MIHVIFTGAPGSGKTTVLNRLAALGFSVIPEAATDVIAAEQAQGVASPWEQVGFINKVLQLQMARAQPSVSESLRIANKLQFFDRSPFCTYALARYLSEMQHQPFTPTPELLQVLTELQSSPFFYCNTVFLFENLGFVTPTAIRRISFDQAMVFERIHREVYESFGYTLVTVPRASIDERCQFLLDACQRLLVR